MQVASQSYLDQLSKGGPQAAPQMPPGMAGFPGMPFGGQAPAMNMGGFPMMGGQQQPAAGMPQMGNPPMFTMPTMPSGQFMGTEFNS
mmetsp:Transcript_42058/g.64462  ORF Transcript_42058/g.64462 Transcript_42058/m.64462 type:complete len:87 (-) Transcript_42058:20-280(-)